MLFIITASFLICGVKILEPPISGFHVASYISNQNLLGLPNFYGHQVEEIVKKYLFTSFELHDILFVWNMACWIFKISAVRDIVMAPWKAVVLDKKI